MQFYTDTFAFSVGYWLWLGVVVLLALQGMKRFQSPNWFLLAGVAALVLSHFYVFTHAPAPSGGAWAAWRETCTFFRGLGFLVFLLFLLMRGGFLLLRASDRDK